MSLPGNVCETTLMMKGSLFDNACAWFCVWNTGPFLCVLDEVRLLLPNLADVKISAVNANERFKWWSWYCWLWLFSKHDQGGFVFVCLFCSLFLFFFETIATVLPPKEQNFDVIGQVRINAVTRYWAAAPKMHDLELDVCPFSIVGHAVVPPKPSEMVQFGYMLPWEFSLAVGKKTPQWLIFRFYEWRM